MIKFLICFTGIIASALCQSLSQPFSVKAVNSSQLNIPVYVLSVSPDSLKKHHPDYENYTYIVYHGEDYVQSELSSTGSELQLLLLNLKPGEERELTFKPVNGGSWLHADFTQAYLGKKQNYTDSAGYYTKGEFVPVKEDKVPAAHFAHDALYQFEGPGWESDKVGYRLYLDSRNRTDIFGKKTSRLVLNTVGKNDLVSDGKESYQSMLEWGQDIFKVGSSLGIGSAAVYYDSVITISDYQSAFCRVYDGNLVSAVETEHTGWKAGGDIFNVTCRYSISAGSRLTEVNIKTDKAPENFCTGLAKHSGTEFFKSGNSTGWNYIALWGQQTIINDNLGIAVFYKNNDAVNVTEDQVNYIVVLNPVNTGAHYYFAAAWEQENGGIKNSEEFKEYLNTELVKLNSPVIVEYLSE